MNRTKQFFMTLSFPALMLMAAQSSCRPAAQGTANNSKQEINQNIDTMNTIIVDVRTPEEWQFDGHAPCSVNYPLGPVFESKIDSLKGYDKVVVVCRSGGRASSAKMLLEQAGIRNVENLGPWQSVSCG
jgi:rhodanese-related sulfurtransferase